jgi:hypothetical protein
MPSIALERSDVIVGVDTHKDEHVAFAIDGLGGVLDEPMFFAANPDGYADLLVWANGLGDVYVFGVEGCGSYGSGLAEWSALGIARAGYLNLGHVMMEEVIVPRSYPVEFRRKVLDLIEAGKPVAEIAERLGRHGQTIYNWRNQDRSIAVSGPGVRRWSPPSWQRLGSGSVTWRPSWR